MLRYFMMFLSLVLLLHNTASKSHHIIQRSASNSGVCGGQQFQCRSGLCISHYWKCDGEEDCPNGDDENGCNLNECDPVQEFKCISDGLCISKGSMCDGVAQCIDGSDEPPSCNITCNTSANMWQCPGGNTSFVICIKESQICDFVKNCPGSTDELPSACPGGRQCSPGQFRCADKHSCISASKTCDLSIDCPDASDEKYTLCGPTGHSQSCERNQFLCRIDHHCKNNSSRCDGIRDCLDGSDEINCDICDFRCKTDYKCLPQNQVCDGINHCADGSDESFKCDMCSMKNGGCQHQCVNSPSGPQCQCEKGFKMKNGQCQDINECEIYGKCSQRCVNTVGSYKCECIRGYNVHDVGSSRKSCKALGPHGSIIFGSTNTVKQLSLAGPHESVLIEINNMRSGYIYDVAFDYNKNTVYWINLARIKSASPVTPTNINDVAAVPDQTMAEAYLSLSNSRRIHVIGNQRGRPYFLSIIRLPTNWPNARKLAYDWIRKQLYLVDSNAGTVQVSSTDGDQRCFVKSRLPQPKDIAVDPFNNELYVSVGGTHPGIARMKTDGSEFKMFVSDNIGQPTGITLDLPGKRLYWLDTKYRLIESIRLDGKGRTVVKYLTTGSNFHTISVFEDLVYWTQKSSSNIFVANRFTGETVRTISAGLSISPGFKLVHEVLQISELCKYPENIIYNVTSPEKQWSKVGDYLNLTCKPGHQLEGSSVIKCQSDGTWFPTPGTCIPQHVETGNLSVTEGFCKYPENNQYNVENSKKEQYKPGHQLVIKCISGYQLNGTSVIECQSDGTWYPTSSICIPQHVDPQSFADGTRERSIGIGIGITLLIVIIAVATTIVVIAAIIIWKRLRGSLKSADPEVSYNVAELTEEDTVTLPTAMEDSYQPCN